MKGVDAETTFRHAIRALPDGVVVVDPEEGTVRFANQAAEELFGRTAADLEGQPFGYPLVEGETSDLRIERPGAPPAIAEVRVTSTTWRGRDALLVSLREVTDRKRAERRARDLIREQTARREAELAARRSRFLADASGALAGARRIPEVLEALAELATTVGDLSVVEVPEEGRHDPGLRVVRAREPREDPEAVRLLEGRGAPDLFSDVSAEVRATGSLRHIPGVSRSWIRENTADRPTAEALEALGLRSLLGAPIAAGGSAPGILYVLTLRGGRQPGSGDAALVEELARRAGLALENARLLRMARHANRAKSDFLNVISHELRTPLTAVIGYSSLLQEGLAGPLTPEQMEYLQGIDRNSASLVRVIDQILLFADIEAERKEVSYEVERLSGLVEDVAAVARPLAEREGLHFELDPPPRDTEVALDSPKVRQVLLHLLANAVKFTSEGGVRLSVSRNEDGLRFDVGDSGIGIPEEDRERIFEAFTQGEPSPTRRFGGTGLGLNLVYNLVRLMGGRIEVESEVGRGSVFTVHVPVPDDPDAGDERPRDDPTTGSDA